MQMAAFPPPLRRVVSRCVTCVSRGSASSFARLRTKLHPRLISGWPSGPTSRHFEFGVAAHGRNATGRQISIEIEEVFFEILETHALGSVIPIPEIIWTIGASCKCEVDGGRLSALGRVG